MTQPTKRAPRRAKAPPAEPAAPAPPSPADVARAAHRAALIASIEARWGAEHDSIQVQLSGVPHLIEARLRLPAYQRAAVWTFERACAFLDTLIRGTVAQSMVFVERHDPANGGWYAEIIDGQQRCLALGLTLADSTGAPRRGVTPLLSLTDLTWHTEPAPDRWSVADLCGDRFWHLADRDDFARETVCAADMISRRVRRYWWPIVTIPRRTPPNVVRDFFRAWNTLGAPFSATDLEALLAAHPDPEAP